jgi:hypothetical protein
VWSPYSPRHGSGRHPLWRLARVGHGHADLSRCTRSRTASCSHHFGLKKSDMTAIDYATCGVSDVIAHSLKLHPQLLADRLRFHARVHAQFADAYDDPSVTRSELDLADRLHSFADAIDFGDYTIPDDIGVRDVAFGSAAQLQDLHPIMQKEIVEQEGARNARPGKSS